MAAVAAQEWNALSTGAQPFVRHEFLAALEASGCVGERSGWVPRHLLLRRPDGALVAAVPMYLKDHSWGEFVFDFAWAQAYAQNGLGYYPKLVSMCPFTPVSGERLLAATRSPAMLAAVAEAALDEARGLGVSSLHLLFVQPDELAALTPLGLLPRYDCRFLWRNRDYDSFQEFLGTLRAARRKQIRRERRRVAAQGIRVVTRSARRLDGEQWRAVYAATARTFLLRGHRPYLNLAFLRAAAAHFGDDMLVNLAQRGDEIVAAAILFRDERTLYGRYWGALAEYDCLHFETCYYRGIEYCIDNGLQLFDPGTQGEHKVRRGFEPTPTLSAHWIADARFRDAIGRYLDDERADTETYMRLIAGRLPYRR